MTDATHHSNRMNQLLMKASESFMDGRIPFTGNWSEANDVSTEECMDLCDLIGTILNGYAYSSKNVKAAVLISGTQLFAVNPAVVADIDRLKRIQQELDH